jgi:PTH1 family peptidyl-tRNA hydrolase
VYAESNDVLLAKPTTGMNASGVAVKEIIQQYGVDLADLHIIVDDVDLPLGKLRLRPKGGDGCHRGMESVIYHLGNTHFPRLRFGVAAHDQKRPAEVYVLKPFKKNDQPEADTKIQTAADAMEYLLKEGINQTMNRYNS